MNKAYIILAHQKGEQLYRLIERLDDGHSYFFLHIDKKSLLEEFTPAVNAFITKIKLVPRVSIEWGGFGLVKATLNAMQEIKNHPLDFNWITLLSGQDYPIKTNENISRYLSATSQYAFFDYTLLPDYNRWSPRGGYYRIDKYFLGLKTAPKLAAKALNFLSGIVPFVRRPVMRNIKPYAGSQWWTMNNYTLSFILDYVEKNRHYYLFHKFTFAADEVFFHSIVMNADTLKSKVENNNKRFFIWPDTSKSHPEILEQKDLAAIQQSDAFFARKFDAAYDAKILDMVDEYCLNLQYSVQQ